MSQDPWTGMPCLNEKQYSDRIKLWATWDHQDSDSKCDKPRNQRSFKGSNRSHKRRLKLLSCGLSIVFEPFLSCVQDHTEELLRKGGMCLSGFLSWAMWPWLEETGNLGCCSLAKYRQIMNRACCVHNALWANILAGVRRVKKKIQYGMYFNLKKAK